MLIVQIAAGLYYTLGSILLLNKLTGTEEYDVVIPTGGSRPITKKDGVTFGIHAFQAGLHGLQRIPDSGWTGTEHGAWSVKMPWEVRMTRNRPPENLYNPEDPYWQTWAERRVESLIAKHPAILDLLGISFADAVTIAKPTAPLPRTVEFELRGEWWDFNFSNAKVDDMSISFTGEEDFVECTLTDMRQANEGGTKVRLREDGTATVKDDVARPVYFDIVYNPHAGVMNDWQMSFKGPLELHAVRTDMTQLRRWFDYENPDGVNLSLTEDPTEEQEIDYEWF